MIPTETAAMGREDAFRPKLLALAYRMLGSAADAEDAVQDAYLRMQMAGSIESPEGWLVKTTTRICLDRLRQAKRRKEYHGPWLPEPVAEDWQGAAADPAELADSLSMAFLVLVETLSPAERAAYILREVFGYEFDQIGELLDKSAANVRQIASRAKKRLEAQQRRFDASAAAVRELADQFFAACQTGDLTKIEAMLAADVTLYSDGGGKVHSAPKPVTGAKRIAKLMAVVFKKLAAVGQLKLTTVNGQLGAVFSIDGHTTDIFSFAAAHGAVREIYIVLNPDKLRRWSTATTGDAPRWQTIIRRQPSAPAAESARTEPPDNNQGDES